MSTERICGRCLLPKSEHSDNGTHSFSYFPTNENLCNWLVTKKKETYRQLVRMWREAHGHGRYITETDDNTCQANAFNSSRMKCGHELPCPYHDHCEVRTDL